ncbi:MAG: DUF4212 domain-containing protein [Gammaproteobacteria bacterium]
MQVSVKMREYWRKNLRITAVLLTIWFVVTYVTALFSPALNEMTFLGFPFGFYMGAQGAPIVYLALIAFYARYMNRLDREYDVHEE